MDLVNSVTQNSNNRNVPMENSNDWDGDGSRDDDDGNRNGDRNNFKALDSPAKQHLQSASGAMEASISATATATSTSTPSSSIAPGKNQVPDYLRAIGMDPRKFWPKKYRFTREKSPGLHNPLTISQRNFYESNGYLIIDECVPAKLLDSIRLQHKEDSFVSEFLLEKLLAKNAKLLQYVKCFCDERLMLMTHQLVETFQTNDMARAVMDNKQTQRQQLFRDWVFLPFRPIDKVVCAITAIEPLEHVILVVPGTHKVGQCSISSTLDSISAAYDTSQERSQQLIARELFECSPENLSSLVEKSKKGFRYVNLKPGQTLFYHPGLVHGFSDDLVNYRKSQLASIAYYAAADCEYVDLRQPTSDNLPDQPLPISLSHFKDKNPGDYSSWIGKPILLQDVKPANL